MPEPTATPAHAPDAPPGGRNRTPHRYTARLADAIESRWQHFWEEHETFRVANPGEPGFDSSKPKFYCLDMFPYPSGAGLHVGHPEGYTATDILCRYKRMRGFAVLHPMGWDAFGLPAEQYAIQTGVHPAITTRRAIDNFRRQLKRFGFCYDWSREFATIDPGYYRWTQWIWLRAYAAWYDADAQRARPIRELVREFETGAPPPRLNPKAAEYTGAGDLPEGTRLAPWAELSADIRHLVIDSYRLAYTARQTVNWCPKLGTALANEEVIDGRSERGGYPVLRKPLTQWMFRITAYADRLLDDLHSVDWPEATRAMQAQWIGRSEGAEADFPLIDPDGAPTGQSLRIFTTRPDTIFGATYMVVAPEHPLIDQAIDAPAPETEVDALLAYVEQARNRSDVERMAEGREKTGVFTGLYALNPATKKAVPIWTSDYVLMGYGTGAIMAVPGEDQRDWDFAQRFNLPIVRTVQPPNDFEGAAFVGEGLAINSANDEVSLNGTNVAEAKARILDWLEGSKRGTRKVNYKLRDWLFSRQRYWGEPFPVVFDRSGRHYPVEESHLPVVLPEMADYVPVESDEPQPLLAKAADWVNTTAGEAGVSPDLLPPDTPVTRETNTMPGWAGSCWYYLRFCDPRNGDRFVSREAEQYWMTGMVPRRSASRVVDAHDAERRGTSVVPRRSASRTVSPAEINHLRQTEEIDLTDQYLLRAEGFVSRNPFPRGEAVPNDLEVEQRNLPHVTVHDATYFVSWRCHPGILLDASERTAVLDSLKHWNGKRCRVYSAIVMPDHVHWLIRPYENWSLTDLVESVKHYAAKEVNRLRGGRGSVFHPERFDHIVRDELWLSRFIFYIALNPVREGIAECAADYSWLFLDDAISAPDRLSVVTFIDEVAVRMGVESKVPRRSASRVDDAHDAERRGTSTGGVDQYVGGAEHAVLHLLYARFWHKILFDLGEVSSPEPFARLFHQGLITSFAYRDSTGRTVPTDEVEERDGAFVLKATGEPVEQITAKMSKTLKNVVNPDDVIAAYGTDTFRLYEMYMGPLDASKPWNMRDIEGMFRFLQRVWRLAIDEETGGLTLADRSNDEVERALHGAIAKVGEDIERFAFNTAIAAMIEFVNTAGRAGGATSDQLGRFVRILAPFAPHVAEELWRKLGHDESLIDAPWPAHDEAMLRAETIELPVQIMGKVRSRITVPADAREEAVRETALEDERVRAALAGRTIEKVIIVPGRIVNIIAHGG